MPRRFYLILMLCLFGAFSSSIAQIQIAIDELNADLDVYNNQIVTLKGIYVNDGTNAELWFDSDLPRQNTRFNWNYHVRLIEGGIPLPSASDFQMDSIQVTGRVEIITFQYEYIGNPQIAQIVLDDFQLLQKKTIMGFSSEGIQTSKLAANCDSCKFAIFVCGFDSPDYWNDLKQKYDYKTGNYNVCPDNIIVLFKGGSNDTTQMPTGSSAGGNFTSGGVHNCTKANIKKAFDYIKAKMKANNCQPAEFQFHTTGHGGGYHTSTTNGYGGKPIGLCGGRLDTSGDESRKINENDMIFYFLGHHDIDGDGVGDIRVDLVNNPNPPPAKIKRVMHDTNGDGTYDRLIGIDYNEDGRVDKNDSAWVAPDLDKNGSINDVGWDDVLHLGGGEALTDDELRKHIQDLIDSTGLNKANSRAELSQCFSGSFNRDLRSVTTESSSACGENEVSYSSGRGANDYNIYQKYFIDRLNAGRTWTEAHNDAVDSVKNRGIKQNPQYTDHSGECLEFIGPYQKGSQICVKVINVCGETRTVNIHLGTHNFGVASSRIGSLDSTHVLKNGESIELCVNKPTETGKYCFFGYVSSYSPSFKFESKWLNDIKVEANIATPNLLVNFAVGGFEDMDYQNLYLMPNSEKSTTGWEYQLSNYEFDLTQGDIPDQTIDIMIPPGSVPGDIGIIYIDAYSFTDIEEYVSYMQIEVEVTDPGAPNEYKINYTGNTWHLAAIPIAPQHTELSLNFPDKIAAFEYDSELGYIDTDQHMLGKGFWLLLENGGEYTIPGIQNETNIYSLDPGWNILQGLPLNRAMLAPVEGTGEIEIMFAYTPSGGYYESSVIMEGESAWVLATDQVEVELMPIKGGILVQGNQIPLELEITATGEELSSYTNKSKIRFGLDTLSTFTTKAPPPTPKHTADIKLYDVDAAGAPILEALYRSIQKTSIPSNDTIRWIIEIDPNGNIPLSPDKTVTLAWDSAGLYDDGIYEHKWMLCNGIVSSGLSNVVIDDMKAQSGYTVSGSNNLYYTLVYIQNIPTSVNENKLLASRYKLKVSPLPFKEKAEIEFTLPEPAQVEAEIFDQLGESIFKFNKSQVLQGSTKLVWFGENRYGKEVASGTYYFKIKIISSDGYKVISGKLIKI